MKFLFHLSRLLGGSIFIFSGFVKGIDPVGSQIKLSDYLSAAGISMPENILLFAAMLLCATEFIAGVLLITGSFLKQGVLLYFIFMALFTPLTLFLAIFNPVSDCGCFGDAIHLTNWETFYKNLVLLFFGIILLIYSKKYIRKASFVHDGLIALPSLVIFILFMIFNIINLPAIDFRPYKAGVNIPEEMQIPENAPHDVYDISLIYEKDGVQKQFSLADYPANDTTWKFVDQQSILVSKGYEPSIKDFNISTVEGNDITDYLLYESGYSLLMVSHNIDKAKQDNIDKGFMTGFNLLDKGIAFYVVTSSSSDVIERYMNGLQFCTADATLLKTIIRSDPGYLLIKDGTIVAKWSSSTLPDADWFDREMTASIIKEGNRSKSYNVIGFYIVITLSALFLSIKLSNKVRYK